MPTVLVVGGTGTVGASVVEAFRAKGDVRVLVTTRDAAKVLPDGVEPVVVDLLDEESVRTAVRGLDPVDVLIYAALYPTAPKRKLLEADASRRQMRMTKGLLGALGWVPGMRASIHKAAARASNAWSPGNENVRMFESVLGAVEEHHSLQHVGLVTGGKAYGMHLTPYLYRDWSGTMHEGLPLAPGPNFYFDQEDRLEAGAERHGYGYLVSRPSYVVGHAPGAAYSVLNTLAVYATLLLHEGRPLVFPGDERAADTVFSWCDAELIGALHCWGVMQARERRQILNISNGDPKSLREIWPVLAACFGMEPRFEPQPMAVGAYLEQGRERWPAVVRAFGLQHVPYDRLTSPEQLAGLMAHDWDTRYDLRRLREAGFEETRDSVEMFSRWIQRLQATELIPSGR